MTSHLDAHNRRVVGGSRCSQRSRKSTVNHGMAGCVQTSSTRSQPMQCLQGHSQTEGPVESTEAPPWRSLKSLSRVRHLSFTAACLHRRLVFFQITTKRCRQEGDNDKGLRRLLAISNVSVIDTICAQVNETNTPSGVCVCGWVGGSYTKVQTESSVNSRA